MIMISPIHAAISAHRAAYDAFQVAPEGEDSELAFDALSDAMEALVTAACSFPILSRSLPEEAGTLLAHLRWWLTEEAENADDYQPTYGILLGRASDLTALLDPPAPDESDPLVAAIVAADMATVAHTAALVHRDEDDAESEGQVDAAGHAVDEAFRAVQSIMPAALGGLRELAVFYARDARIFCRWETGGDYLGHIAAALTLFVAREGQAPLPLTGAPIRETSGIPGQAEIAAAWRALPAETKDRIGIIATDMAFQGFVHGDGYLPESRPVPGDTAAAHAIRNAAEDAGNARLSELYRVIETEIPGLFGPEGQNPDWAVAMGARR